MFPNLIAAATRRKQVSSFLERGSIVPVAQHFGSHFVVLPDAVVLCDPGNFSKHSAKRRAYNLLLARHTFHQRCDWASPVIPGNAVAVRITVIMGYLPQKQKWIGGDQRLC